MSHPDPNAAPRPHADRGRRGLGEPGARVAGEHLHPALHERFTVIDGELTVVRDRERTTLGSGEAADIEAGVWHDWWNEADVDAIIKVEITPARASSR